jgi:hypothetical protein
MQIIGLDIHAAFAAAVARKDGKLSRLGRVIMRRDKPVTGRTADGRQRRTPTTSKAIATRNGAGSSRPKQPTPLCGGVELTRFRGARQAFNGGFSDAQDASALFT